MAGPSPLEAIEPRQVPTARWKIWLIADYGRGDLAFGEVSDRLFAVDSGISAEKISVAPFTTMSTGFVVAQIGLHGEYYPGKFIYSNTAPRGGKENIPWHGNEEQRLLFAVLENKVPVLNISTGYNWSFVRDHIAKGEDGQPFFFNLDISNEGSQFRSRDIYPGALERILSGDTSILGDRIDPASIPDYPRNQILYIDGYGNIKISTPEKEFDQSLKEYPFLYVTINGITKKVANGLQHLDGEPELVLRAGSSGGKGNAFLEIQLIRGQAFREFEAIDRPIVLKDDQNPISFSPAI